MLIGFLPQRCETFRQEPYSTSGGWETGGRGDGAGPGSGGPLGLVAAWSNEPSNFFTPMAQIPLPLRVAGPIPA